MNSISPGFSQKSELLKVEASVSFFIHTVCSSDHLGVVILQPDLLSLLSFSPIRILASPSTDLPALHLA